MKLRRFNSALMWSSSGRTCLEIRVEKTRLLAELHHSRAARIRVAGGGAGAGGTPLVGSAPDAQASALGLPHGQPQPPKRLSPSLGYNEAQWSSARSLKETSLALSSVLMAPCAASKREAATPTRFGSPCAWLEGARTITWKPIPPDRRPTQLGGENEMARQRTAKGPSSPAWVRKQPRGAPAVALLACFIGLTGPSAARGESAMLDLSRALGVTPPALTGPERKAGRATRRGCGAPVRYPLESALALAGRAGSRRRRWVVLCRQGLHRSVRRILRSAWSMPATASVT